MATLKPLYGTRTSLTISGLNSLTNGSTATSNAVDNSSGLYQDFLIEVYIDGTAATNAWLEVRLLPSNDNTNFGTWESGISLGIIDLSVDLQRGFFSIASILYQAPKYFKIAVRNSTGASLAASGNEIQYLPVQIQSV